MKNVNTFVVIVMMLIGGTSLAKSEGSGKLTIHVNELRSDNGKVMIAIMDSEDLAAVDWRLINPMENDWKNMVVFAGMQKSSLAGTDFIVHNLPENKKLSIYIFHDENSNYMMDLNESKMPAEGFVAGRENGAVSVSMDGNDQELDVKMLYLSDL